MNVSLTPPSGKARSVCCLCWVSERVYGLATYFRIVFGMYSALIHLENGIESKIEP